MLQLQCAVDYGLIYNNLFDLFDDLVNPDFDLLLDLCLLDDLLVEPLAVLRQLLLTPQSPRVPFVHEPLPLCDELCADVALLGRVLLLERAAVLLEVPPDLPLLLLREESRRARAPEELLKPVEDMLLELLAAEIPYRVSVLELRVAQAS